MAAIADYSALIDAETWAFIERTESFSTQGNADPSVAEARADYNRMCRSFAAPYPSGVVAEDTEIATRAGALPIRRYRREGAKLRAQVLFFHGGGFVLGGLDSHDDVCAEFCAATGHRFISIDYRLAPEYPFPAAVEDALAAFHWAADASDLPIILCGDSAGGTLAAGLAHVTRHEARGAIGQLLIYPALGGAMDEGSYLHHANAPLLSTDDMAFYYDIYRAGHEVSDDPRFSPLADPSFADLPRTVIITAECDPLCDDGRNYRDRILAAGGDAIWIEEPGLVHGYLRARHSVERARASFARMTDALSDFAGN